MTANWVISVIADLRRFAGDNGLPCLAAELAGAEQVARAEIALAARQTTGRQGGTLADGEPRRLSEGTGALGGA